MAERGRDLAWINNAAFVCRQLCEYKIGYEGGDLDQLGPADFRGYMLDFFPRKVTADDSTIEFVPEALDLFAEWLGESGRISAQTAGRIRKVVKDAQKEFLRAARDPRNFGMAKSLFGSMKEAGVDIQDQAQVQGFINMYNASLAGGPVGPSPVGPPAKEARPPKDRWRPAPGEPPPVLTAPCPCGSGKRYKKCCMPR